MSARRYYGLVFSTINGQVVDELPLYVDPTWTQQVNQVGTWTVQTPIGDGGQSSGIDRDTLIEYAEPGRYCVAICYGDGSANDPICQAGPIWTYAVDDGGVNTAPTVTFGGSGFWGLLNARWQIPAGWNKTTLADPSATATYIGTMQGIASMTLTDTVTRGTLPVDIPTPIPATSVTTNTQTYYGYDLTSVGQRLSELTQIGGVEDWQKGPDVLFQPYFSSTSTIRWQALIGNPYFAQSGGPVVFEYGSSLQSVQPAGDGSHLATTYLEKGNGVGSAVLWSQAVDQSLIDAGWPLLESIGNNYSQVTDQSTLDSYAQADLDLYGRTVETWTVVVRADSIPLLGSYYAGYVAVYALQNHPWIPDGDYSQRILGLSNGQNPGEVVHILQALNRSY